MYCIIHLILNAGHFICEVIQTPLFFPLRPEKCVQNSLRFMVLLDYSLAALKSSLQLKNLIEQIYQDSLP